MTRDMLLGVITNNVLSLVSGS